MWWTFAVLGYLGIACMCVAGVLSQHYEDNLAQRLGMASACFGCLAEAVEIAGARYASPGDITLCIGLVFFVLGLTHKVLWYAHAPRRDRRREIRA